jgi:hypothetical protein
VRVAFGLKSRAGRTMHLRRGEEGKIVPQLLWAAKS